MTLRKGLVYSNGKPVKASDFAYTIERSIKIPWGGSGQFYGGTIDGAAAYAAGQGQDDLRHHHRRRHRQDHDPSDRTVRRVRQRARVPVARVRCRSGTPMKNEPNSPPPGVGPYMITNIVPNASFSVVKNPQWASMSIPGIPAGNANINVKISSNVDANALSVLKNCADVFDWADTIPGSLLPQIQSQASSRFSKKVMNSTYYIFLNTKAKPFSSQLAREAVIAGLDQNAMSRLGSGTLIPGASSCRRA